MKKYSLMPIATFAVAILGACIAAAENAQPDYSVIDRDKNKVAVASGKTAIENAAYGFTMTVPIPCVEDRSGAASLVSLSCGGDALLVSVYLDAMAPTVTGPGPARDSLVQQLSGSDSVKKISEREFTGPGGPVIGLRYENAAPETTQVMEFYLAAFPKKNTLVTVSFVYDAGSDLATINRVIQDTVQSLMLSPLQ